MSALALVDGPELVDEQHGEGSGGVAPAARLYFDPRVRAIFRAAREALLVVDDDRRYLRANERASRMLGAPVDQILGRRIDDFTAPEHLSRLEQLWAAFRRKGWLEGDYEVRQETGVRLPITFRADWYFGRGEHLIAALEAPRGGHEMHKSAPFTPRELDVISGIAMGRRAREIGEDLYITQETVRTHVRNAMARVGARSQAHLVAIALAMGSLDAQRFPQIVERRPKDDVDA